MRAFGAKNNSIATPFYISFLQAVEKGTKMIITFNKEKFLEKLIPSMATVSNKSTIVSIEGVLIETMEDNSLRLTTYDMLKGVRSYVEDVTVSEHGKYIINAGRLLQILRVMPDGEDVTIKVDANLSVTVGNDNSSFSLFAMNGKDFPSLPDLNGDMGFSLPQGVFKRMIAKVAHSVAVQHVRPALCGAYFSFEKDMLDVTACDGFTLSKCRIKCDIDDILILLNKELDIDLEEQGVEERALLGYEVEYDAMLKVNQAIRENKKISFRYQKFTIKDRTQQVDRRGGATYKISPFKLIINDGYYYVLAWNAQRGSTITFRLDRMKGVEILNEPREGNMEFSKINMEAYTQQHFGMFSGDKKRVSLRFTNNLLDTMVDRFGTGADVS
jgi:hypothetical protein